MLETNNEDGEAVKTTVKKRVIKKKQGDREQNIEIVTVEEEGKEPETTVTIEEAEPVEEKTAKTPKKKKLTKKLKNDDLDYIQYLIDMEIPKTELEVFEKPEFEITGKVPKDKTQSKKQKVSKNKSSEDKHKQLEIQASSEDLEPVGALPILRSSSEESEHGEAQLAKIKIVAEEQPIEITEVELPGEDGVIVKQVIKKRKIKKQQGPSSEIIEVITVEEEGKKPEVEVTVQEITPTPTKDKPKKKKLVHKIRPDEMDTYIQSLIDAEIPKTDLEIYEKLEFPVIPKTISDQSDTNKKKRIIKRPEAPAQQPESGKKPFARLSDKH